MTRKDQIEKNIEAALNSLDHLSPASPAPFFFTRLSARLTREERNVWVQVSRTITRPAIAGFSVVLIVLLNIFVVMHNTPPVVKGVPDQAEIAVADEYNRTTSIYNIDNVQP